MEAAHRAYGETRWNLLTDDDRSLMEERKWQRALSSERGVSGIRHSRAVKCLHAHLAHFLSGEAGSAHNIVGKWTMQEINNLVLEREKQTQANRPNDASDKI
eukprot:CAMPEP_0116552342 /NCGR_PEP_ID=MMETSP0397-20121206/6436_1 /TAXON_ID=216820 /ORGANISM="Cyclophora tenuis, Strain ECT3854" /LENGTH=101 /DNA_ID=CAMNT_0004077287 /DNA_START=1 /DNA_END=306 /DNA_ORIENTATION=-